jgi:mevalonate pyrophosphate decarboxylase
LWEKNVEIKEMKEQLKELVSLLQQSEAQRKELIKEQNVREQTPAIGLASSASVIICLACIIMYNLYCSDSKIAQ